MDLEKSVVRIICGDSKDDENGILGTGFFIDKNKVVTAYHVVSNCDDLGDKIFVNPINLGDSEFYEAKIIEQKKKSQVVILEINKEFDVEKLKFVNDYTIKPQKDDWVTFGYPKVKRQKGHIEKGLVSRILNKINSENVDIDLEIKSSNINDFSGLSGAPFVINDMLLGVIIEQSEAAGKVLSIGAASINEFEDVIPEKYIISDIHKTELKKLVLEHTKKEINKNIRSKKYIKDIFVETSDLKEKARYFTDKILFYDKLIYDIENFDFINLNYYLRRFSLPILKIEIEEELKVNVNIININERLDKINIKINNSLDKLSELKSQLSDGFNIQWNKKFEFQQISYKIQNEFYSVYNILKEYLDKIKIMQSTIFMITAKAGQGKTNFVCDFTENFLWKKEFITLYFNAKDFNVFSMEDYVREIIFKNKYNIEEIKKLLHEIRIKENKDIIIIIDGLNENANIAEFREKLTLFIQNFKIDCQYILTCREEYFEERYSKLLEYFNEKELYKKEIINKARNDIQKERLFYGYFHFFNLSFTNISNKVFEVLTEDTLLLRTFCEAYGDANSDKKITLPTMHDIYKYDVFKTYFDKKFINIKENKVKDAETCEKSSYEKILSDIAKYMIDNKKYSDISKVQINSFVNEQLLKEIIDEDIVFREDIIIKKGLREKEELVINFTFDEFRDYLIANYLLELFGTIENDEYFNLINDITNNPSEVIEGVQKYLFYQGKVYNDEEFNKLLFNQIWYENVFLENIYSLEEKYILDEDIDKLYTIFKKGIKYSAVIINNLIYRYSVQYFSKLNIQTLIDMILRLKEDEFRDLIIPVFKKSRGEYDFQRIYEYFPVDDFLNSLSEILNENIEVNMFGSLFEFLIILVGINYKVINIFEKYFSKCPDKAVDNILRYLKYNSRIINLNIEKIIKDILSKARQMQLDADICSKLQLIIDQHRTNSKYRGL